MASSRSGPGRKERAIRRYTRLRPPGRLLGAASEETDDNSGGDPIVVLMKICAAERGAVVVGIEQTDVNVPGWVDIQPAADFIRETVLRSVVSAAPADLSVRARSSDQGFRKRSQAPSIAPTVKVASPEVISVKDILGAADGYGVVATVGDELQPRFYVPAERAHCAVYVGPSSASTVQASKGVAAKEFQQRCSANPRREWSLPACPGVRGANRRGCRFNGRRLRLRGHVPTRLRDGRSRFRGIRCGCRRRGRWSWRRLYGSDWSWLRDSGRCFRDFGCRRGSRRRCRLNGRGLRLQRRRRSRACDCRARTGESYFS